MAFFAAAIPAIIGAGASIINGISQSSAQERNAKTQERINRENIESNERINAANRDMQMAINSQNLDYARSMTQAQWERDDNAHQREVADLQAAGLSPLASLQGSANGAVVGYEGQAPVARQQEAYPYKMQAPQFDANGVINAMLAGRELDERIRHQKHQDDVSDTTLDQTQEKINLSWESLKKQYDFKDKEFVESVRQFNSMFELQTNQFEEVSRHNKTTEELELASFESHRFYENIQKQLPQGWQGRIEYFDNYDEYVVAWEQFAQSYSDWLDSFGDSNSANFAYGKRRSQSFRGFSLGYSSSETVSDEVFKQRLVEWQKKNPFPLFDYKGGR